jgi:outer membrane protein OmpA-like peptidoglycan-associated protein
MKRSSLFTAFCLSVLTVFALVQAAMAQAGGDVRRRTVAITYLKDPVKVPMTGTTLRPNAHGEATVERWRKRNESEIDITIESLIPAFNYGGDYNTYVLWAITPEGQVSNLGEFRLSSGGTGHLHAATPYQTFAMIVTAEPHYLVKLPSRKVILENQATISKNVQIQSSEIYFTGDSGKYYTDNEIPAAAERDYNKIPMELLQARRAVQIARLADGERYDASDYRQAVDTLRQAEDAFHRGANAHEVGRIARDAISIAVKTRDIAEDHAVAAQRRAELQRRDEEVAVANANASDLSSKLTDTDARLRASEMARNEAQDQLNRALREAADARSQLRSLQSENDRLRADNDRLNRDLSDARARVSDLQSQYSSTSASLNEAKGRAEAMERAERDRREAEARQRDFASLQASLGATATVRQEGGGFVVVLPDGWFAVNRMPLALSAKAKMDALGRAIAAHPDARFTIEGHSDARAGADSFALGRAQSVADYITALGVPATNFKVVSQGASVPLSSSKTVRGRAMNRRVELVFVAPR